MRSGLVSLLTSGEDGGCGVGVLCACGCVVHLCVCVCVVYVFGVMRACLVCVCRRECQYNRSVCD